MWNIKYKPLFRCSSCVVFIMSWTNCTIILNSDSTGSFYTGDVVTGMVVLELKKAQKIKRLDLEVAGLCNISWSRPAPTVPYIKVYSEKRKILSIVISDLFRDVTLGNKIPAGVHRSPFHFVLPSNLPSSFESSLGKTRYFIKLKSKPNYKLKKSEEFHVLGNVNINHIEEMLTPTFHEFSKTFRNHSGNFHVSIKTYRAYAPKQTAPFEITIRNEKKVSIDKIRITLVQKRRYSTSSGYADEEKNICKLVHRKFTKHMVEIWFIHMEIPDIVPTSLHLNDPMIDISYYFRIEVKFPFHLSLQEEIPVIITTTPVIHSEFEQPALQ